MKSKWVGRTVGKDGERLMRNHKISKCYLDTSLSMLNPERLVLGCSMPTCRIWPRFVYGHGVRMATSQNFKYCLLSGWTKKNATPTPKSKKSKLSRLICKMNSFFYFLDRKKFKKVKKVIFPPHPLLKF